MPASEAKKRTRVLASEAKKRTGVPASEEEEEESIAEVLKRPVRRRPAAKAAEGAEVESSGAELDTLRLLSLNFRNYGP